MSGRPPKPGTSDIELCSGNYLNLENPEADPNVITLHVIAHHLSQANRYAGAPRRPLPVTEHAVLVASYLEHNGFPANVCLSGLHHDDAEAFLHDITRPLKEVLRPLYEPIEDRMYMAIHEALGLSQWDVDIHHPEVKNADQWALAAEAHYHLPTGGREWWCYGLFDPTSAKNPPMVTGVVYRMATFVDQKSLQGTWLDMHYRLCKKVEEEQKNERDISRSTSVSG